MWLLALIACLVLLVAIPALIAILGLAMSMLYLILFWIVAPYLIVMTVIELVKRPASAAAIFASLHDQWARNQARRQAVRDWSKRTLARLPGRKRTTPTTGA